MTKDVWITICGLQYMDEESREPVEMSVSGEYYNRNGKHYILYDEVMEGFEELTKNRVKLAKDCVEIIKKGVSNVHMVFRKGVRNRSFYQTPYGPLTLEIDTHMIEIEDAEDRIEVRMEYTLDVDEAHLADCSLTMKICAKEAMRL